MRISQLPKLGKPQSDNSGEIRGGSLFPPQGHGHQQVVKYFAPATAAEGLEASAVPWSEYHSRPDNFRFWARNRSVLPANRFEEIRIMIAYLV